MSCKDIQDVVVLAMRCCIIYRDMGNSLIHMRVGRE